MVTCYESLGFASGAICIFSVVPQIYKTYTSGSSEDLSTSTFLCMYLSLGLGTAYGFLIDHVAIYVSDMAILGLYVVLHAIKLRNYRGRTPESPRPDLEKGVVSS